MLYYWYLLLLYSSLREWASVPRSRPLVLMNNDLVSFGISRLECLQKISFYLHRVSLLVWFKPCSVLLFGF